MNFQRFASTALAILGAAVSIETARAQSVLHTFVGEDFGDEQGWSVAGAGDVDGDGRDDLVVGSIGTDEGNPPWDGLYFESGSARVYSGLDGSLLHTFQGQAHGGHLGWSVAGAGDVNADGFDDVVVSARQDPAAGYSTGSVLVYSGLDGSELLVLHSGSAGDAFGLSVDGAGDVNGDGHADVVVGAPNAATAYVYSGKDGSVLHVLGGGGGGDDLGYAVAGAGDVDGDGRPDLIVGAPRRFHYGQTGYAMVYSGADGSPLRGLVGKGWAGLWFGAAVAGAGDVDADGYADLIVGSPVDELTSGAGEAWVYSGADGTVLHRFQAESVLDNGFGQAVDGIGDLDGDGHADLLVAVRDDAFSVNLPGGARVYSGADGSELLTVDGDAPGDAFGFSLRAAGDVNGDGRPDLIAGAPFADPNGSFSGLARVLACCDFVGATYCGPAVANSTGLSASISANGSARVSDDDLALRAWSLPPGATALFLASLGEALVPGAGGGVGTLCLGPPVGRFSAQLGTVGPDGAIAIDVDLAQVAGLGPALPGESWRFQVWYRDALPVPTSNLSDAVRVDFQ